MARRAVGRRRLLAAGAGAASAALASACAVPTLAPTATAAPTDTPAPPPTATPSPTPVWPGPSGGVLPRRPLGDSGVSLSVVGFGGIVVMDETPESAATLVSQAIARGINYFDVAPSYGNAESRLGPALEPYRDSVFLACKTEARTAKGATADLATSLERLRTDHFDLYQLHGVKNVAEVEAILTDDGALAAFIAAKEKGQIDRIGFSAHSEEAALALLDAFAFDTILFPVNWACWYQGGFGPSVIERAQERGTAILALKALARRDWLPGEVRLWPKCWYAPAESPEEAALALRWTLSRPVTAAVSPSHAELLWWACAAAEHLAPLTEAEEKSLVEASARLDPIFPLA